MSQYRLRELFQSFNDLQVMVIGDAMIDSYFEGRVDRISPEAPVPIVAVSSIENRLGGAANVALNVKALGAKPFLCTVIGDDRDGANFRELMQKAELDDGGVIASEDRVTTVKTRIIGNHHQLIRVDAETDKLLNESDEEKLLSTIRKMVDTNQIDVIIFEDYDKGIITASLIKQVVELAQKNNIPTAVDPKKRNFMNYRGVTLFKPNFKELKEGLKKDFLKMELEPVKEAISELHGLLGNTNTFVTLSELGVVIQSDAETYYIPAHVRDIADVSGAGDTVISVAALCLAKDEDLQTIADLSNLAGGLVCERVGVVPVDKNQLLQEAISLTIQ